MHGAHSCLLLKKTFCSRHSDGSALRWLLGVLTGLCQSRISTPDHFISPPLFTFLLSNHRSVLRSSFLSSPFLPLHKLSFSFFSLCVSSLFLGSHPLSSLHIHTLEHTTMLFLERQAAAGRAALVFTLYPSLHSNHGFKKLLSGLFYIQRKC